MDDNRFDDVARSLSAGSSRRATLGIVLGGVLSILGVAESTAERCKKRCGRCRRCNRLTGKCIPKPNGTDCGGGRICRDARCICPQECCADGDCDGSETCLNGKCVECQQNDDCPGEEVCCLNESRCRDIRNDATHCGQCQNGQCPSGAICGNGDCGLKCDTVTERCFEPDCFCGRRVDPSHEDQKICASIRSFHCGNVPTCSNDAECAPGTLGFRQVCVSGLCPDKEVCARPCA